ncbi:CpsD/CapB family tyrosine-protein kinase, partial [Ligilactobacillus sp.]|uniref:CpsD/CapB family tyrosine-protein kinase n=1 Tax=Ligilactobacillus sp. TaxID=2767921 RepID=UPI002FE033D2
MSLFKKRKKHLETTTMDYGVRMITVSKAGSANTEQFNTIRTNIEFSSADEQFKSIMLTSSMASEGKSTVSANLAVAFARQGKNTLLVDADLRRPTLNATFSISDPKGLTNFLTEKDAPANSFIYRTTVDHLSVMPSGPVPPNPSELIGSRKMAGLIKGLESAYDIIIYDAPPLLSV